MCPQLTRSSETRVCRRPAPAAAAIVCNYTLLLRLYSAIIILHGLQIQWMIYQLLSYIRLYDQSLFLWGTSFQPPSSSASKQKFSMQTVLTTPNGIMIVLIFTVNNFNFGQQMQSKSLKVTFKVKVLFVDIVGRQLSSSKLPGGSCSLRHSLRSTTEQCLQVETQCFSQDYSILTDYEVKLRKITNGFDLVIGTFN